MVKEIAIVGLGLLAYVMYSNDQKKAQVQQEEAEAEAEEQAEEQAKQQEVAAAQTAANNTAKAVATQFISLDRTPNYLNSSLHDTWAQVAQLEKTQWTAFTEALTGVGYTYAKIYNRWKRASGGKMNGACSRGFNNKRYKDIRDALAERSKW